MTARVTLRERPQTHAEINEFRRRTLIEGTIASLAAHGVSGTTVKTICAAAGSSRGLIAHYFDSKEELMAAALRHLFTSVGGQVRAAVEASGPSAVSRLQALPKALFSPEVFTETNRTAFLSFWHEIRFNDAVRRANRELYQGYVARTEQLFRDAAEERGVAIDARRAALGLVGLTDGMWLGMSIHDKVISPRRATDICRLYIERELAGGGGASK